MMARALGVLVPLLFAAAASADDPDWLQTARSREGRLLDPQPVASEDGWLQARVPARLLAPIVREKGSYTLALDIGAGDTPLYCEVLPEAVDAARMLVATRDSLLETFSRQFGEVERHALEATVAGQVGGVPYLGADWFYVVATDTGRRLGTIRQTVFDWPQWSVTCWFTEVGYRATVDAVQSALVHTLKTRNNTALPDYEEVNVLHQDGHARGYSRIAVSHDGRGVQQLTMASTALLPIGHAKVVTQETHQQEWVRPDGRLIRAVKVVTRNGDTVTDLSLERDRKGSWIVRGRHQGRKILETLSGALEPDSWIAENERRRTLVNAPDPIGTSVEALSWDMEQPLAFTPTRRSVFAAAGAHWVVREEARGVTVEEEVRAADGSVVLATLVVGEQRTKVERVWTRGDWQ